MPEIQESKIVATERLRREGRWEEASMYRDEIRKKARADGHSKADANEQAWQAMSQQYPPLPQDDLPGDILRRGVKLLDLSPDDFDGQSDLVLDTLWVYDHLTNKGATAEAAPSLGAWSLLLWARESRNRFFEQVLPKAMSAKKKVEADKHHVSDDKGLEEIEKMIKDFERNWRRDLIANTDEVIKRDVKSTVAAWERQFKLDLTPDAREHMYLVMVHLVDKIVAVLGSKP